MKKCLLIRYGAFGDCVMASCLLPYLKRDGYTITANVSDRGYEVLMKDPRIDHFIQHTSDEVPNKRLEEYWDYLSADYDKVVNLSKSIEHACLAYQDSKDADLSQEERHKKFNINYYENTIRWAGYEPIPPVKSELYFSNFETKLAREFIKKFKGNFIILWGLSGSAMHKAYPWAEGVMMEFLKIHKDVTIIVTGDGMCHFLAPEHPRVINRCDTNNMRFVLSWIQFCDLVVGPETGLLSAAACYDDIGKIVLLSHSTEENLTKYWENCIPLAPFDCECYPCHTIIYDFVKAKCVSGHTRASKCMEMIQPHIVLEAMETFYRKWRSQKGLATIRPIRNDRPFLLAQQGG